MEEQNIRSGQDFLKPEIVPKRVPFPVCQQIGKRDGFVGVVHAYNRGAV